MRKRFTLIGLGVITTFLLISLPAGRHGDVYPQASRSSSGAGDSQTISRNTFIQIAQKVSPSVVNVFNFIEYGAFKTRVKASLGTGFIIDSKKGLVLTNHHVIADAKEMMVALQDKRVLKTKILGSDPFYDVAILEIQNPPADIKQANVGNSDKLAQGELVVAIGQPRGYEYTVTTGIICGFGREIRIGKAQWSTVEYSPSYLQIDAIIDAGNSGGPLFNLNGEVVGINTVGFYKYGGSIPINTAMQVKEEIIKNGRVIRAYLGLRGSDFDDELAWGFNTTVEDLAKDLGLKAPKGVFIQGSTEGSPAESIGLTESDVLIELSDKKVDNLNDYRAIIKTLKPETDVKVKYIRKGKEEVTTVKLAEMQTGKKPNEKQPVEGEDEGE
ncbi:MAG TPA: trypsin-like peptidase domain-containing protein [Planctomycetota bacterium]|nr:trypsin-like peptidase domain-containing protein [Planctomycetota bacterium]